MSEFNDIAEKFTKDSQEMVDRFRREADDRIEKLWKQAEDLDNRSIQNFSEWREYLHRYYVLILAFIAGTGVFSATQSAQIFLVDWGIYLALGGVLYGFLAINVYFYFERRWFQISNYVRNGFNETHKHPGVEDDPVLASRINISAKIEEFKLQLKEARKNKDQKKTHYLKTQIRGHKTDMRLMKYLGQQFGFIEHFWVGSVILSFLLTSVGVILIFAALLER